jgi:hypothetical protein
MFFPDCSTVIQSAPRWFQVHLKVTSSVQYTRTHHLGDRKAGILRQSVQGSVRAVRAVRNTWVFVTEIRVLSDAEEATKKRHYNSKFAEDIHIWHSGWSILIEMTDKMHYTGNNGLWNLWNSPRHVQSRPHGRICRGSYSMELYIKSRAMTVTDSITR